jgi:hypothetical protein
MNVLRVLPAHLDRVCTNVRLVVLDEVPLLLVLPLRWRSRSLPHCGQTLDFADRHDGLQRCQARVDDGDYRRRSSPGRDVNAEQRFGVVRSQRG